MKPKYQETNPFVARDNRQRGKALFGTPNRVLIQILSDNSVFTGLRKVERDETVQREQRVEDANKLGVNAYLKGGDPNNNLQVVQNAPTVSLAKLVTELEAKGFRYMGAHSYTKEGKRVPTNVLQFYKDVGDWKPQELPAAVREYLATRVFAQVSVWARDAKLDERGRIDSILCSEGQPSAKKAVAQLRFTESGNSYEVDRPE